jgi:hypothetical protein
MGFSRSWVIALAALAMLTAGWSESAHARVTVGQTVRAAVSVRGTLAAASRRGALTADQRSRYRRSLRSAVATVRRLAAPGEAQRRDELASQVLMLSTLASRGRLTPARMRPLFRQLDVNRVWFARSGPPHPAPARISVPGDPLVYAYYPGHGLQFQPLFTWSRVNGYWFAKDYAGMQRLVDRLSTIAVPQPGHWVSWEYSFDYPGSRAPWLSGMAQGVAVQALARAWQATSNPRDLALARRALVGLGRPLADGGLLQRSAGGRWWPLYAEQPSQRVLNGDLQTVISLYDYASITGDTRASRWAREGARLAASRLPAYDSGAWSLYQGSTEATLGYHDLMTLQLRQLALKTGILDFRIYADRFAQYRVTAPVVSAAIQPTAVAYPSVAGSPRATATARARLDKVSSVKLIVSNASGAIVATRDLGSLHRGAVTTRWDGHAGGRPAAPGVYLLWLRATDLAGNRSPRTFIRAADVERDRTPPAVRLLRIERAGGHIRLHWRLRDNASAHFRIAISTAGHSQTLRGVPPAGRRTLALPAGRADVTAAITITDQSHNRTWRTRRAH